MKKLIINYQFGKKKEPGGIKLNVIFVPGNEYTIFTQEK